MRLLDACNAAVAFIQLQYIRWLLVVMPSAAFWRQIRYGYPEPPESSGFDAFVAEQKRRHTGDDMSPLTCETCHMPYASNVMEVYWCESWSIHGMVCSLHGSVACRETPWKVLWLYTSRTEMRCDMWHEMCAVFIVACHCSKSFWLEGLCGTDEAILSERGSKKTHTYTLTQCVCDLTHVL